MSNQAHVHGLTTTAQLTSFLTRRHAPRDARAPGDPRRSALAIGSRDRFFALLKASRLPVPLTNVMVNGHRVDFYWPEHDLIVETDGWATHGNRRAFERDHARDLDHAAAGVHVLRITRRQLDREPHAVTAPLGARLLG
ncbi:MAG: endonuclease domain-containing protein [Solirubrobacteraceae bacterium]